MLPEPLPWQVYAAVRALEVDAGGLWWHRVGAVVGRGSGKSRGLLAPYILDALTVGDGVLGIAQNLDTCKDTFDVVLGTVEDDPHLRRRIVRAYRGKGGARLELRHPSRGVAVYRLSVTAKGCRGPRAHRLAVDEAAYVSDEVLSAALYVQMGTAAPGRTQVLAVSTAGEDVPGPDGELPWFSRWRAAHLEGTDPRLLWMEWSLPDGADPTDESLWPWAVPALGHRITHEEVRSSFTDPKALREVLSRWGVTSSRTITADMWEPLQVPPAEVERLQRDRPAVAGLGLAVSPDEASTSLLAGYRVGGRLLVKVLEHGPGTAWALDVVKARQAAARVPVTVDRRGPAGPLADDLAAAGVPLDVVDTDTYANGCAAFLRDVRERTVAHYAQPVLDLAVAAARQRDLGERWVWARRAGDVAALEAATLALVRVRHAPTRPRVR